MAEAGLFPITAGSLITLGVLGAAAPCLLQGTASCSAPPGLPVLGHTAQKHNLWCPWFLWGSSRGTRSAKLSFTLCTACGCTAELNLSRAQQPQVRSTCAFLGQTLYGLAQGRMRGEPSRQLDRSSLISSSICLFFS